MAKILVIHGPNLNMLGTRETDIYGKAGLDQINADLEKKAAELGVALDLFQSNHEGQIVDKIQGARGECAAVVINPAAFTHTSVAIRDALLMLDIPIVEIHPWSPTSRRARSAAWEPRATCWRWRPWWK